MFVSHTDSFYQSTKLLSIPSTHHAYSTKVYGDSRIISKRKHFFNVLGISSLQYQEAEQIHGNSIARLRELSISPVSGVDGLVVRKKDIKDVAIGIRTGDCIPLLLSDTKGIAIGAVHAGWKGVYTNIASNAIEEFIKLGIDPKTIIASIGPHIGACCYTVPEERAVRFLALYGTDTRIARCINGIWFLDLGYVLKLQLLQMGVKADNIDMCRLCTRDNPDLFYSYRRDTKETFGEMVAVIW
jgi:polyphenol oxidase